MLGRSRAHDGPGTMTARDRLVDIRGGVYFGSILTGVVVAFGAMFILTAIITGILVALGLQETNLTADEAVTASAAAAIGFVIAQFLSYMWGGYTAGRMGRGAGVANGLLVALSALVIGAIVALIAVGIGATYDVDLPFRMNLPFDPNNLGGDPDAQTWGVGLGLGVLIAMFLGGALGGAMGSRWHTKLERDHLDEAGPANTVDVRDHSTTRQPASTTTGGRTTTGAPPDQRA